MSIWLIVIQTFLGIGALLKDNFSKSEKIRRIILFIIFILMFVILFFQLSIQSREDFKNKYDGMLNSPIKSTATTTAINFGGAVLNWTGDPNIPQIKLFNGDYIKVILIDRKANLTTQIRDSDGHLIGDIINNKWRIYSPQFIMDRNFNSNSLEIKNLNGDVTFQVQIYGNEVKLAGFYYIKEGMKKVNFLGPWIKNSDLLFLYPSIEHRGELNPSGRFADTRADFYLEK